MSENPLPYLLYSAIALLLAAWLIVLLKRALSDRRRSGARAIQNVDTAIGDLLRAAAPGEAAPAPRQMLAASFEEAIAAYGNRDYATALRHFQILADAGQAKAQYNLEIMHSKGQGVPKNAAEAVKWLRLSAGRDYPDALFGLGVMYYSGQGVPEDDAEAAKWYSKAADHGHAGAQYTLGTMYAQGVGVPQKLVSAHMWLSLAAAQGNQTAANDRDIVERTMPAGQISEARRLAAQWKAAQPRA